MLYITTRDDRDAYTAYKALHADIAPDGGLYIPFRLPTFTSSELLDLMNCSFGEVVARLLNLFFSARLTGWDVESRIGRSPVKITSLNRKILTAELWHNLQSGYSYMEEQLISLMAPNAPAVSNWARLGIHIAALFGTYSQILQQKLISFPQGLDISVYAGDFTAPMAVLYAKNMGLPVGTLILCSEDNSALWDLINRGEMGTSLLESARKLDAERMIHNAMGTQEVLRFKEICDRHGVYSLSEEQLPAIADGMFASVVGVDRINTTINSVYRTNQYLTTPLEAVCHAGLQDYRAKAGESCTTLLFAYDAPSTHAVALQKATGLKEEKILQYQKGN